MNIFTLFVMAHLSVDVAWRMKEGAIRWRLKVASEDGVRKLVRRTV